MPRRKASKAKTSEANTAVRASTIVKPSPMSVAIANATRRGYENGFEDAKREEAKRNELPPKAAAYVEMMKAISQAIASMAAALDNCRVIP